MTETLENHPGEKQVWLSIVSEVTAQGDTDRTEFVIEGAFYRENDAECLSYRETEVSGMSGGRNSRSPPRCLRSRRPCRTSAGQTA